jgi:hypothetical protein
VPRNLSFFPGFQNPERFLTSFGMTDQALFPQPASDEANIDFFETFHIPMPRKFLEKTEVLPRSANNATHSPEFSGELHTPARPGLSM